MFRKVIFWSHLVIGLLAAIVVFILCLSGALLSFEQQSIDWAESSSLALPPAGMTERLPTDQLVASAMKVETARPGNVRYSVDPKIPVRIAFANRSIVCINAYTGVVLGRGATSLRAFYAFLRNAHVALALPKESEKTGSAIVGACNLGFIFLMLTGFYLWWPRKWHWNALRNSMAIRFDVAGKQRDWNWHNAFGFWALIPLFIMATTGVVLAYQSANQGMLSLARKYGSKAVASPQLAAPITTAQKPGWSQILSNVEQSVPAWHSMSVQWPDDKSTTIAFMVSEGNDAEAEKLVNVSVNRATAAVTQVLRWENREPDIRARMIARHAHTGALGGLLGQVLAAFGCLAGVMLTYTGIALSLRRFFGRKSSAVINQTVV